MARVEPVGDATVGTRAEQEEHVHTEAIPITVVICTKDRAHSIGRAVESVLQQTYQPHDVVIIDQSVADDTRHVLDDIVTRHPRVHYVHLDKIGLGIARNAGVEHATGDILACTDDDCVVPETWLETIAAAFTANPEIALLYGQVLVPNDVEPSSIRGGAIPALPFQERRKLSRRDGFKIFGMGANFAVRRAFCQRIGGFDAVLGAGGKLKSSEDFDFEYRVFRAGGTILLEPDVVAYHYGFRTDAEWPATLRNYGFGDGAFYLKHVRAGDLYAARLLLGTLCLHGAREVVHFLRRGPSGAQWGYVRSIPIGAMYSLRFAVDRRRRLYSMRPPMNSRGGGSSSRAAISTSRERLGARVRQV